MTIRDTAEVQKETSKEGHLKWGIAGWTQAYELQDNLEDVIDKLSYWLDKCECICKSLKKNEKCFHCDFKKYKWLFNDSP